MKSLTSFGQVNWLLPIILISLLFIGNAGANQEVDSFLEKWNTFLSQAHGPHVEAKLKEEAEKHGSELSALAHNAEKDFGKKLGDLRKLMPWHEFILECKYFVQKLFAENHTHEQHKNEMTQHIWQLSQVDTADLDHFFLADLYSKHLAEKTEERQKLTEPESMPPHPDVEDRLRHIKVESTSGHSDSPYKPYTLQSVPFRRALVVGIDPFGLYSAIQLFMAGIETTVVADAKQIVHKPICLIEPKFIVQLRFLLGHKFQKLLGDSQKFVDLIQSGQIWPLKCPDFLKALEERLTELKEFVDAYEKKPVNSLDLHFVKVLQKLEKPKNDMVATLKGKETEKEIPVDLLIFTDSGTNKIRNHNLGQMEEKAPEKLYGGAVIDKPSAGEHIFANGDSPFSKQLHFKPSDIKWPEHEFDKLIEVKPDLALKYANFYELLLNGIVVEEDKEEYAPGKKYVNYITDDNGRLKPNPTAIVQNHLLTIHEVGPLIYFVVSTPQALQKLLTDLKMNRMKLIRENPENPEIAEEYHILRKQIERLWFLAVFKFCLLKLAPSFSDKIQFELNVNGIIVDTLDKWKDKIKNDQIESPLNGQTLLFIDPANTSTFPVDFKQTERPARFLQHDSKSLVIALGDALASPNALVENGFSLGLMGVETTVKLLKQFQRDSNANRSHMRLELEIKLNAIRDDIMKAASEFVKKSENVQENAVAGEKEPESVQKNFMAVEQGQKSDKTKRRKIQIRRKDRGNP